MSVVPTTSNPSDDKKTATNRCISERSLELLYAMQEDGVICDAVLKTEAGGHFPVHRNIMSVCSPYFRALFTTRLHSKERTEFTIPGISPDMLKLLIQFAYLRCVPLTTENVAELMVAADQFHVLQLMSACENFILDNIAPENCIGFRRFGRSYSFQRLDLEAHRFIQRHFVEVAESSDELLELPAGELADILADDELNVHNEEKVWETVLRWIDHDPGSRPDCVFQLLRKVRMGFLDTQYFIKKVKNNPHVHRDDRCRPLVIDALKFLNELDSAFLQETTAETPEFARPRVPHEVLFAVGGWSGGAPTSVIESYDSRADRWIQMEHIDPMGPRAYHGCVVLGLEIYIIGGFDGVDYFNSCRCFDVVAKTWREISPMYARRCYVSAVVLSNVIYALGGYDGHHRQNTAEKYQQETNQWTMITPMNVQRSDASAKALGGRIYIVGGFNGQECMSTAEVYDPETSQWTMIAPMRFRRSGVSCVAHHRHIYAVGGFNGISRLRSAERYNLQTNSWAPIADMFNFRSNFAIEVTDDMIYAIGGFNGVTTIADVECYDEKSNEWLQATDMNVFRSALGACVVRFLPNIYDYVLKNRDQLVDDKRQRVRFLARRSTEMTD